MLNQVLAKLKDRLSKFKLTEELSKVSIWEGGNGLSKEQIMSWAKEFLVKVGMKTGSDTEERFAKFLLCKALDAFVGVFLDFFKSKIEEYTAKNFRRDQILCCIEMESKKSSKGRGDEVKDDNMDKVVILLAKNDAKGVKNIVNDLNTETKKLILTSNALVGEVHSELGG